MFDDESGLGGSGEQGSDGAEQSVVYELDVTDTGAGEGQGAAPAAQQPAAAAAPVDPRDARIAELERAHAETAGLLRPFLARLQADQRGQAERPPIDPSRLDSDPSIKPSDLHALLRWEMERQAQGVLERTEANARAVFSEQQARGQFSAETLGAGNDYDSMVNRYVAPLVSQNPAIDQLLQMAAPGNPAAGRMIFATIVHAIAQHGDNLPKGIKAVLDGLGAYNDGARDARAGISKAATVAAARIVPGAAGGPAVRKVGAADIARMSDQEFNRYWEGIAH